MKRGEARRLVRQLARDLSATPGRALEKQAVRGFLLGALVALDAALALRFEPRSYPLASRAYEAEVTRHLRALASGAAPTRGQWLAGFYFNSYLQHLAGAYHRLLKLTTGRDDSSVPCLVAIAVAQGRFATTEVDALTEVHRDVNDLKHSMAGRLAKRRVSKLEHAVRAATQAVSLYRQLP